MHILLVDDKKKVLDFIRPLLEQQGNTIDTASNGLDAFERRNNNSLICLLLTILCLL